MAEDTNQEQSAAQFTADVERSLASRFASEIQQALIEAMSFDEILSLVEGALEGDYIPNGLIYRLADLCDTPSRSAEVAEIISRIVKKEPSTPYQTRRSLDTLIRRVIHVLPVDKQTSLARDFAMHRRTTRRRIGLRILARHPLPENKAFLLSCYEKHHDPWALTALTRGDFDLRDVATTLLQKLDDTYEQARVFEKLIIQDNSQALRLASQYPVAFVWGAGRTHSVESVPIILQAVRDSQQELKGILGRYEQDKENNGSIQPFLDDLRRIQQAISLAIWALGKIGATPELQELARQYGVEGEGSPMTGDETQPAP